MPKYQEKLYHNFHELNLLEKIRYWLIDRWSWPKEKRFFFDGNIFLRGSQMYIEDRKGLYDTIIEYRPRHCFEIGTYTGGGSTFFISSAFARLGKGMLYTTESDAKIYKIAVNQYKRFAANLMPFIDFINDRRVEVFEEVIKKDGGLDCFFLDGAEDGEETLKQYKFFEKYFKKGTIMMAHDWNTEKTIKIKPIIESDKKWDIKMKLDEPESVGFIVAVRK